MFIILKIYVILKNKINAMYLLFSFRKFSKVLGGLNGLLLSTSFMTHLLVSRIFALALMFSF